MFSESFCRVELVSYLSYCIEIIQHGFLCFLIPLAHNVCFIAQIFPVLASIDSEMEALATEPVSMYSVLKLDRLSHVSTHETITQLLFDSIHVSNILQSGSFKARHWFIGNGLLCSFLLEPHPMHVA